MHRRRLQGKHSYHNRLRAGLTLCQETEEATLTLRDKKRLVVAHMLLFAYMGDEAIVRSVHDTWPFLKQDAVEATGKEPMQWAQLHYVDLYELATFLMFEELQEFAKRTIIQLQDYDWEEFRCDDRHVDGAEISSAARVLRYIYTRIPVEGGGLRAEITANCVKNWGNVDGCQEIIDVVTEFEPVAWQVGVTFRKR